MRHVFRSSILLFASLSSCAEPKAKPEQGPPSAGFTGIETKLSVDARGDTVILQRGDVILLKLPANAFVMGTVTKLDETVNYDPAPILLGAAGTQEPDGLNFAFGESFTITESSPEEIHILVTHEGGRQSNVTFTMQNDGRYKGVLVPVDSTNVAYLGVDPVASPDEGFYGLGEYFDHVNHRGQNRAMQIELDTSIESGYNEAHVPVPFIIGTNGWGLFVENRYPALFEVATKTNERIAAIFGTGKASVDGLTFHLFAAPTPLDVTRHYYDVTGYPKLPAPWGLGPTVWRDENMDQAQVENDVKTMRDLDLPMTAIWLDRPYASAVNSFDFDPLKYTDPQAMIGKAHDLGFRMSLWHTPYLDQKTMPTPATITPLLDEATSKGYFPAKRGLLLNKWGDPIDFTNPDAFAWWQSLLKKYTDMGIEGFKLDYGEDVVPGVFGARNIWEFADGSDERTMHGEYQEFYHHAYSDLFPDEGSFILCRGGTYGDQKQVTVVWPGDLDASFAKHRDAVDENGEKYTAVGGLPAALIAGLSLGPSGYPFFGSDTGGYRHSPPDKELFTRWFEITALSPVMQIGTSTNDVAWEPTPENKFDAEMLGWYRNYTRLHLRLFPYTWSYAKQISKDGRPIQRALGLAYPDMGIHPDDVFLLGDYLLVAPVVTKGATKRDVPLPKGRWLDWWTGEIKLGDQTASVTAGLENLPLYLAEGGIVPLLRPTIDSLSPTTTPGTTDGLVDSYATDPGVLWARVFPGGTTTFTLFDGATLKQEDGGPTLTLTTNDGTEFKAGVMFELIGEGTPPKGIMLGSTALAQAADLATLETTPQGYVYTPASNGSLWIKVPAGSQTVVITR